MAAHGPKTQVRSFVKRRARKLAVGLAPALAFAANSAEAELVEVRVRNYTELRDGSLQVTLENGRSIIVGAGDWTVVEGRVYIESSVVSSSGTGVSSAATGNSDFSVFGYEINPWMLAGGALAGGYLISRESGSEDSDDDDTTASSSKIEPSGTTLTGTITNSDALTDDDAGRVVIADVRSIFTGAEGNVTYQISVKDSSGAVVSDLVYMNGSQILILSDPEVSKNGVYTITVTGTDTATSNTAEAAVFVTVAVDSEAVTTGSIADATMDHNDAAGAVVVSDVSVYFEGEEGTFTYEVSVKIGSQDYGDVLTLSGTSLVLASDLTDDFVELLAGTKGDEDITLSVTITATDSADGKKLTQDFDLTLDATGVNDAPELALGVSSTVILNTDSSGQTLGDGDLVSFDLSALNLVVDEEDNDLLWAISSNTPSGLLSIGQTTGIITGSVIAGDDANTVIIDVTDAANPTSPVTLSLYIDFTI